MGKESHQTIEELAPAELSCIKERNEAEKALSPLPQPEPRLTCNPELAAQLERLGIPHSLISQEELWAIGGEPV